MPIHRISLKNFKCFKETDVELSRITVLTGENSSGKSSLIYGILAPFQSKGFPLYLSPNGKYVNMGDFRNMSFKNSKNSMIEINIVLYGNKNSEIPVLGYTFSAERYFVGEQDCYSTWIVDTTNGMPVLNCLRFDGGYGGEYHSVTEIKAKEYGGYILDDEISFNSIDDIYYEDDSTREIRYGFKQIDDNEFNFIGPFRLPPERTYYRKTKAEEKIGISGEGYIDQILEWEQQKAPEFKQIISILKKLELIHSLKTQQLKGGRFEVNVKTKSKSVWASLADVGFGISQFLPVIVADLQLSDDSTLILAQPEIHLHPSIQASLADYFVNRIKETGKQYIIETHSEYLLNRFRLDIVKGKLDPADISVYYFEPSPDGSITYRIEFTKDGQIKNAPKGFFDTYMIDTMDIALYA